MSDTTVPLTEVAPSLDQLDPEMRVQVLAKTFSVLADPVRLQIVQLLAERGELTVGELADALPVSQPRVSVHLRCLTDCGFATGRRQGRRSYYRLTGDHVTGLVELARAHAGDALPGLLACLNCGPGQESGCC